MKDETKPGAKGDASDAMLFQPTTQTFDLAFDRDPAQMQGLLHKAEPARFIAFFLVVVSIFFVHWFAGIVDFPYDAGGYWRLSDPGYLGNFPISNRGYFLPYLVMPLHAIDVWTGDNAHWAYRILTSIVYSFLLTGPVAEFFNRCFGGGLSAVRRSWIGIATLALYPGLFLYPLSDLPAALLLICGLLMADSRFSDKWFSACLFSGILIGAAYNVRTIYLVAFIVTLVLLPLFFFRGRPLRIRIAGLAAFMLGATIVAIPQMVINKHLHGVATPMVITGDSESNLMVKQLYWGIVIQRYETLVRRDVPAPSFYYADPAGIKFRAAFPQYFVKSDISAYLAMLVKHPLFFLGLYGRHMLNGIDVRDGMVYTNLLSERESRISLACFSLFAFCTFVLCMRINRRWMEWGYLAPILATVVSILPGAVETRFFLPLYLIMFGVVATQFKWKIFYGQVSRHWAAVGLGYLILASLSLAVTSAGMTNLTYSFP
jgi:hypothetical protein